tara:strand:- start:6248 stop:6427 length:180 start_codon:yes stop_codon:yes gene_type:complete
MKINPLAIFILFIMITCLRIIWRYEEDFGYEQSKFLKKIVIILCIILAIFLGFILNDKL